MKYGFKFNSNTSFRIVPATDSAGYSIDELKEMLKHHYSSELKLLDDLSDDQFLQYYLKKEE